MESITTEVLSEERTRDGRGRRLYTASRKRKLLKEYEESGLTQKQYARKMGLNYTTWVQRAKKGDIAVRFQELVLPSVPVAPSAALVVTIPDRVKERMRRAGACGVDPVTAGLNDACNTGGDQNFRGGGGKSNARVFAK